MKRYNVEIDKWYEQWCEEAFTELSVKESKTGKWVRVGDALKLQHQIERMQKRIDKLEGRVE